MPRLRRPLVAALFLLIGAAAVCNAGHAASPAARAAPHQDASLDLSTPAKPPRTKLQEPLSRLSAAQRESGPVGARLAARRLGVPLEGTSVRVIVEARPGLAGETSRRAPALGTTVEARYLDLVQLLVPVEQLNELAREPSVAYVRLPLARVPDIVGQGVGLIGADGWHLAKQTGAGVKVAVLDLGFAGYQSLLGTELPASVVAHSCRADADITGGGESHGSAVAEIVHEVAPGAQIYLANFDTEVELAACVNWLIGQGVQVVNFSIGFVASGPGDGTGFVNDIVDLATSQDIVWVNSAGNQAQGHWMGGWVDGDGDDVLEFSASDEENTISNALGGSVIYIFLKWDDQFGTSCNDYDLYVLDSATPIPNVVASSTDPQDYCTSGQPTYPVEALAYEVPALGSYHVVVHRYDADGTATFHLYSINHDCPPLQYCSKAGSIMEPGDNPNVLTVGAVRWSSPGTIEFFSSRGPTDDGRMKPEIVAPDGVSNVSWGAFYGTSASAPHATGAAALVEAWQPGWTQSQVRAFLAASTVDVGPVGPDDTFGYGRLSLPLPKDVAADTDGDTIVNGDDPDDDNDGCTDTQEAGSNPLLGGRRNPHNFWDLYDVPTGPSLARDRAVSSADMAAVVARFGSNDSGPGTFDRTSDPLSTPLPVGANNRENYHPAYDRGGPNPGLNAWNLLPPNGSVTAGDIASVVAQFGHSCA